MYEKLGIGGMIRMNPFDGSKREVVCHAACATRSAWTSIPKDKVVWFTDNQTDGMGDDTPPGELNRITKARRALRLPVHPRQERADRGHGGGAGPQGHEAARELDASRRSSSRRTRRSWA